MAKTKTVQARNAGPRARPVIPDRFGMDEVLWAAWLYYEQDRKQDEIAAELGVSRASVFNLLQRARDEGIVRISIDPSRMEMTDLSKRIKELSGISECYVLPAVAGGDSIHAQIGRLGARVLQDRLREHDVIGVAWGRTVLALSWNLNKISLPNVTIAQVTGSSAATFEFSPVFCTSNIAARLNARCENLHAPGVVSSPEVKRIFMIEPAIESHFALLRSCTKAIFGVTQIVGETLLVKAGFMSESEVQSYRDLGAVGFVSGYFFDRDGQIVNSEFDKRHITMPIDELKQVPERICVGGGAGKADAICGMLRGNLATVLVTDDVTARQVVERLEAGQ